MLVSSVILLVSAILPLTVGATHVHNQRGRHQELAQRARGDVGNHKRSFDNARFTFYDVGLGACGQYSSPNDFIVALNVAQYGAGYPGPQCFKSITIWYGDKTAQATIMDKCMGCPYGGLDFSQSLFSYFASESGGVLYGSWRFNDGVSKRLHHYAADTNATTSTISASETSTTSTSETPTTSLTDTSTTSTSETPTTSLTDTSTTSTSETPTTSLTDTSTTSTNSFPTTSRLTAHMTARV
ncbi:uncharacterized protein HD556DRAFT_1261401 [Suillus plorans]|uniref:RlpA-like double-psi beta-barrel-protein domain-containing protein-containing protein n=1 Tax=Suillus plorans TaxID=116603 RepID=A0A9P7DWE4_9AGAM|nr:uncharacterized protein HD556DRAFT_1261401 [Suillus plorans]KAG1804726.1 hypothetical protein HD556DRAFT_1261401 [Suillus plorans]